MYEDLAPIEEGLAAMVAELDPAVVHGPAALEALERVCRITKLATTATMLLGRRVHETDAWKSSGTTSAAHLLARLAGISLGDAMSLLGTAKKMAGLPKTDEAARQGKLSAKQAAEVSKGATADPAADADLLGLAEQASTSELTDESRRRRFAAAGDDQRRHARMRANRALHRFADDDGSAVMRWKHVPEIGAELDAILSDYVDDEFADARRENRREQRCAYAADALMAALRDAAAFRRGETLDEPDENIVGRSVGNDLTETADDAALSVIDLTDPPTGRRRRRTRRRGADAKVIVRIDHAALVRGHSEAGETCEIAGIGAVPVTSVAELMDDAFIAAVIVKGHDVHTVAHLGRQPSAYQQTALQAQGTRCAVLGCPNVHRLERDHREDWARTHHTRLDELDWLCTHHHDLKTHHGYRLAPGTGPRPILAPHHQHTTTTPTTEAPRPPAQALTLDL
jgi:hypothetical protein